MNFQTKVLNFLLSMGIGLTSRSNLLYLRRQDLLQQATKVKLVLIQSIDQSNILSLDFNSISLALIQSTSQLGQDLLGLLVSGYKKGGYFVEFGATNGRDLSNTYILEKYFAWDGILAEPAKLWHHDLKANRFCAIETDCVWEESNARLIFNEVSSPELSTIDLFSSEDMHVDSRKSGKKYSVNTISLNELLKKHEAPYLIDYLSIDTEGSEYEILKNFNFENYQINFITCEHNFTDSRDKIYDLLKSNGYERVFEEISNFDDWYIHTSLIKAE
jgi:FkbM family methyltransferase